MLRKWAEQHLAAYYVLALAFWAGLLYVLLRTLLAFSAKIVGFALAFAWATLTVAFLIRYLTRRFKSPREASRARLRYAFWALLFPMEVLVLVGYIWAARQQPRESWPQVLAVVALAATFLFVVLWLSYRHSLRRLEAKWRDEV